MASWKSLSSVYSTDAFCSSAVMSGSRKASATRINDVIRNANMVTMFSEIYKKAKDQKQAVCTCGREGEGVKALLESTRRLL